MNAILFVVLCSVGILVSVTSLYNFSADTMGIAVLGGSLSCLLLLVGCVVNCPVRSEIKDIVCLCGHKNKVYVNWYEISCICGMRLRNPLHSQDDIILDDTCKNVPTLSSEILFRECSPLGEHSEVSLKTKEENDNKMDEELESYLKSIPDEVKSILLITERLSPERVKHIEEIGIKIRKSIYGVLPCTEVSATYNQLKQIEKYPWIVAVQLNNTASVI